jgi:hypothetical protein
MTYIAEAASSPSSLDASKLQTVAVFAVIHRPVHSQTISVEATERARSERGESSVSRPVVVCSRMSPVVGLLRDDGCNVTSYSLVCSKSTEQAFLSPTRNLLMMGPSRRALTGGILRSYYFNNHHHEVHPIFSTHLCRR